MKKQKVEFFTIQDVGGKDKCPHYVINTDSGRKQSSRQDNCPPCHVLRYSSLQFQDKMVHTRLHVTQRGNNEVIQLLKSLAELRGKEDITILKHKDLLP